MNPYEAYGAGFARKSRVRVVQSEKDAPLVLRGAAKEIAETTTQLRRYEQHKANNRRVLLAGRHGRDVQALLTLLKSLTPESAPALLRLLERFTWFQDADDDERAGILSMIDDAIVRMRERNGLSPIDDSLPGEEPTVFEICRENLITGHWDPEKGSSA
jgi:hypothetical protein